MRAMLDVILFPLALFITIPLLATWLLYLIRTKIHPNKQRGFIFAVNWTTIFYILAVLVLIKINFDNHYLGVIICFLLLILSAIIVYQWKKHTEIQIGKAFKILWRLCFLGFSFAYIFLVFFSITTRILFD